MGKWLVRALVRLMVRLRVDGRLPDPWPESGVLVVANHQSLLDGVILWAWLPVEPVFIIHKQVARNRLLAWALRWCDHVTVESDHAQGMKSVKKALRAGRAVVLFPEGRMTTTGGLMKVYDGADWLLHHAGVPVLPVWFDGLAWSAWGTLSKDQPRFWRPWGRVQWQAMLLPEAVRDRGTERLLQQMALAAQVSESIWSALHQAARRWGWWRAPLEDGEGERWSYARLLSTSLMLRPVQRGMAEGEKLGVLLPNRPVTLAVLLSAWAGGRSAAMLNITAGAAGIRAACQVAGIRRVVCSRAFLAAVNAQALPEAMPEVSFVWLEDWQPDGLDRVRAWAGLLSPSLTLPVVSGSAEAVVLFTSGSEGLPKGVSLSHDNLLTNVAQTCAVLDFSPADRFFVPLPLFHSFGLTVGALLPLLGGIDVILFPSPLLVRQIPERIYDRDCTVLFGSSSLLAQWGRSAARFDFRRLRYVIAGAEKLQPAVRDLWLEKFGLLIFEGYGVTETAPVIAVNTRMANRLGTVGRLVPGMQAQLLPVDGLSEGGRLQVCGPNVMQGYYLPEQPEVLSPPPSPLGAPWYDTGDVALLESEGFLRILGRVKRFAKVGGEMVSLELTERLAQQASPLAQHGAVALADVGRGERIVLLTTDTGLERAALLAAARALSLPELVLPRAIHAVTALPLLGSGKLDLARLSQMAQQAEVGEV